jgi:hypothetical protein
LSIVCDLARLKPGFFSVPAVRIIEVVDEIQGGIPPEHQGIHQKLQSWGRWCHKHRHAAHCYSLEGAYRAPRGAEIEWETAIPPPSPQPRPDDLEGLAVELIWRLIPHSLGHRTALKLVYVWGCDTKSCCRQLHIKYHLWPKLIYRARQMALNLLLTNQQPKQILPLTIRESLLPRDRLPGEQCVP